MFRFPGDTYLRRATNTSRRNSNIIVPEGVRVPTIRLPSEVNARDLGLDRAPSPLPRVGVVLRGQPSDGFPVQPRLNGPIRTQVVLKTLPAARGKSLGGRNAVGRQVGKRRIVGLAVVHEDLGLAADAKVLLGALCGVGHGDERDVRVSQGL
jgi:hypothetical protein